MVGKFIVAENLQMCFRTNGSFIEVFRDFNFEAEQGSFVAIVGPSGCGKTTFLRLLGALVKPTGGRLAIDGCSTTEALAKHFFSFVFQNPVLLPWRNVRENVRLVGEVIHDPAACSRADEMIERVGLGGFEQAYPDQLSGGMKSRVAIARALTFHPQVLLMDEPFGALDDMTRTRLNLELGDVLCTSGATCFFVTHSIDEAIFLADRVIVFSQRPARIIGDFDVGMLRPRIPEYMESPEFIELKKKIRKLVFQTDDNNTGRQGEEHEHKQIRRI